MKKLNFLGVLIITLCFVHQSYAQDFTPLSCDEKADLIISYKNQLGDFPDEILDEMLDYISTCASRSSPKSFYAKGMILLEKKSYRAAESAMQLAGYYKHGPAQIEHGMNYLHGKYNLRRKNYGKASSSFRDAAQNNYKMDLVNYLTGYVNLKGLNSSRQFQENHDYPQAKYFFEHSNHPMAKHWLAVMYYYGYGVEKDEQKALQMLSENDIFNSRFMLEHLPTQNNDWIPISAEERATCVSPPSSYTVHPANVNKTFTGNFIEFDWFGLGVKRLLPATLTLDVSSVSGDDPFTYDFTIEGQTISGTGIVRVNNWLYFDDLTFTLPRLHQDHPEKSNVTYKINQLNVGEKTIDGIPSLVFRSVDVELLELKEHIKAPIRLILHEEGTTQATSSRAATPASPIVVDKNFATISPNPIGDQFNITYTLHQTADIQVSVYDFYGQQKMRVPSQKNTSNGEQVITINSAALPSGTYIIQMTIDGQPYSKTVVKL